ncbi:hypothetical protein BJX62DRAFT_128301 [Aspergillus germanicus]
MGEHHPTSPYSRFRQHEEYEEGLAWRNGSSGRANIVSAAALQCNLEESRRVKQLTTSLPNIIRNLRAAYSSARQHAVTVIECSLETLTGQTINCFPRTKAEFQPSQRSFRTIQPPNQRPQSPVPNHETRPNKAGLDATNSTTDAIHYPTLQSPTINKSPA